MRISDRFEVVPLLESAAVQVPSTKYVPRTEDMYFGLPQCRFLILRHLLQSSFISGTTLSHCHDDDVHVQALFFNLDGRTTSFTTALPASSAYPFPPTTRGLDSHFRGSCNSCIPTYHPVAVSAPLSILMVTHSFDQVRLIVTTAAYLARMDDG